MARGRNYQANFTMGAVSSELAGRVDLTVYVAAAATMANFLPAATGPARRRPGFLDEGAPASAARLIPFQRSRGDRVMLEFGNETLRIWNPDGSQVMDGGDPYEIASPFAAADLAGIRYEQSNDVLFLVHASGDFAPMVLKRLAADEWEFTTLTRPNGPWLGENPNDGITIAADDYDGSVTLNASADLFLPEHVGVRFRLRAQSSGSGVAGWAPDIDSIVDNELMASDGKVYRRVAPTGDVKTGTNPPVHDRGTQSDGKIEWEFLHDGAGIVEITAVTDPQEATALVYATLPTFGISTEDRRALAPGEICAFDATPFWAEEAWSDRLGYPTAIAATDDERLAFGGTPSSPGFLAITRTGGFTPAKLDFTPGLGTGRVLDDDAVSRTIAAGGDPILWLQMGSFLTVGSGRGVYVFGGSNLDDPLSPAGSRARRLPDAAPCEDVPPVLAGPGVIYVEAGGRGLRMVSMGPDQVFRDEDLALFAEDLVKGQIIDMAWAPSPNKALWIRTAAGELLSMVYHAKQQVFGWQTHPLPGGFTVESLAVLKDDDGFDQVWLVVAREGQRRVWRQARPWRRGDPLTGILYLDGMKLYAGAAAATLGGFDHLEGEEIRVLGLTAADEVAVEDATVDDGEVTLSQQVVWAVGGLRVAGEIQTLPLDMQGPAGSLGQLQSVQEVALYLTDFVRAKVAFGDGPLEEVRGLAWEGQGEPGVHFGKTKVGNVATRLAKVRLVVDDVWPATVLGIGAEADANG